MLVEGNRRERKKRLVREQIEAAAVELFLIKGFGETTVAEVMQKADYGTGTFYNYYKSKEDLLQAVVCQRILRAQKDIESIARETLPTCEKLTKIILSAVKVFEEEQGLIQAFMQLRAAEPSLVVPIRHGDIFRGVLMDILREGQETGQVNPEMPAEVILDLLHGILQSVFFRGKRELPFIESVATKLEILFDGIKPRGGIINNAD